jgi:DNA ligase-1
MLNLSVKLGPSLMNSEVVIMSIEDVVMKARDYRSWPRSGDWVVSEKLDGCRGLMTGAGMLSRRDKPFACPWKNETGLILDGELCVVDSVGMPVSFEETVSVIRSHSASWSRVRYFIFDVVDFDLPYSERIKLVPELSFGEVIPQYPCASESEMLGYCSEEGAIIRSLAGRYTPGPSWAVLKYKRVQIDTGVVVGLKGGRGRNSGRTGSLEVLCDGLLFGVSGLSDTDRVRLKIGDRIRFKYNGRTAAGVPRHAQFLAESD